MKKKKPKGIFITLEGGEGCGKTTHVRLLKEYLLSQGYSVVTTHEPGGTEIGGMIREVLLDPSHVEMVPLAELLLYLASRAQHIEEIIVPALRKGRVVLCDRFSDSTFAYQSCARGIRRVWVEGFNSIATGGLKPSLTILLDCPPEIGLRRVRAHIRARNLDRFEVEDLNFHRRVRKAFRAIARKEAGRIKVVDVRGSIEKVQKDIRRIVDAFLQRHHWTG